VPDGNNNLIGCRYLANKTEQGFATAFFCLNMSTTYALVLAHIERFFLVLKNVLSDDHNQDVSLTTDIANKHTVDNLPIGQPIKNRLLHHVYLRLLQLV